MIEQAPPGATRALAGDAFDDDTVPMAAEPRVLRETLRGMLEPATVGSLAATVAHGGNNRLTVILSCLDLLASADIADPDLRSSIALASDATQRLADEFRALLATARRPSPDVRPVALDRAVARARDLDAFLYDDELACELQVPSGLWVAAERERVDAALLRLFQLARHNAVLEMRIEGGAEHVAQRSSERPGLRPGDYCRLAIEWRAATWPAGLWRVGTAQWLDRVAEPGGLEFAAVEAFVAAQRGCIAPPRASRDGTILELFLPASDGRA